MDVKCQDVATYVEALREEYGQVHCECVSWLRKYNFTNHTYQQIGPVPMPHFVDVR